MVVWNGQTFYYKTLGIQPNEIVDTTAAGDSFCGGLLFIFSLHDSLRPRFLLKPSQFGFRSKFWVYFGLLIKIWLKVKIFYTKQLNAVITAPVKL